MFALAASPGGKNDILGCLLTPQAEVEIGSPVVGVLARVLVDRGDTVKKGQLLAQLVDDVERAAVKSASQRFENRADVAAAKAAYEFAQKKADNSEELLAKQFISQQARDQAVSEARVAAMRYAQAQEQRTVAREDLAVANAQLGLRSIIAPFNGVVVERYLQAGARIEDKPVIKLAQIDPLHAEVVVSASRFGHIRNGSPATLTPELQGSASIATQVARVDAVVDAASNTFRVRLSVPQPWWAHSVRPALPGQFRREPALTGRAMSLRHFLRKTFGLGPSAPSKVRRRAVFEEVEARLLYSADFAPGITDTTPPEIRLLDSTATATPRRSCGHNNEPSGRQCHHKHPASLHRQFDRRRQSVTRGCTGTKPRR